MTASQFTCPKCGGHEWGTADDIPRMISYGYCHTTGCGFSWIRTEAEDAKVGVFFTPAAGVAVIVKGSQKEKALERAIADLTVAAACVLEEEERLFPPNTKHLFWREFASLRARLQVVKELAGL